MKTITFTANSVMLLMLFHMLWISNQVSFEAPTVEFASRYFTEALLSFAPFFVGAIGMIIYIIFKARLSSKPFLSFAFKFILFFLNLYLAITATITTGKHLKIMTGNGWAIALVFIFFVGITLLNMIYVAWQKKWAAHEQF